MTTYHRLMHPEIFADYHSGKSTHHSWLVDDGNEPQCGDSIIFEEMFTDCDKIIQSSYGTGRVITAKIVASEFEAKWVRGWYFVYLTFEVEA